MGENAAMDMLAGVVVDVADSVAQEIAQSGVGLGHAATNRVMVLAGAGAFLRLMEAGCPPSMRPAIQQAQELVRVASARAGPVAFEQMAAVEKRMDAMEEPKWTGEGDGLY